MSAAPSPVVGFAIIGCGLIGRKRAQALITMPGAALRVTCDVQAGRAVDLAKLAPGCRALTAH